MRLPTRQAIALLEHRLVKARGMLAQPRVRLGLRVLELALLAVVLYATQVISHQLWLLPKGDVEEYHAYALAFWTTRPLLHSLPVEYPPLAIVPFSLTLLPPIGDYAAIFAIWMGALVMLGYLGFLRFSTRPRALLYIVYLVLGAAATLLGRFDIVPALVTLAALWATERGRFGYAYVLLAVGILLKLYPGFLVPIVMIAQWRSISARSNRADGRDGNSVPSAATKWWRGRLREMLLALWRRPATKRVVLGVLLCAGLTLVGFLGALILDPSGALSDFSYASQRPLQVESTPASILWLGTIFGIPAGPNYSFVSLNYVGVLDVVLKPLSTVALAGGCLLVYWRQARGKLSVGQAFVAALCVVLVANKIFSPQYLIWVLPVVAYVAGFDLLWVAICILTTCDFPIIYQLQHPIWWVTFSWQFMPVLALRNGLLLWVTVRAIVGPHRNRMREAADPRMALAPEAETRTAQAGKTQADAEPALSS